MKILLIGEYYSTNLGDPLLCRVVENIIKKEYPNAELVPVDMSGKTDYSSFYSPSVYSSWQRWYFRLSHRLPWLCKQFPLLRVYNTDPERHMRVISMLDEMLVKHSFDIAVFAGGSLFMDYFAGVIGDIVTALAKKNIPVIFHACGMSQLTSDTRKILYRAIHRPNVKWISLRDSYDLFVNQFSPQCPVVETYDTALLTSHFYRPGAAKQFDYGIGLISISKYTPFQKELLKWARNSGKTWRVFTNGSCADYLFAQSLLEELNIPSEYLAARPQTPQELVALISSFRQVLSFRMHSQIVASSLGIPSFGFAWDPKIARFYCKLGFPNNCSSLDTPLPSNDSFGFDSSGSNELYSIAMQQGELSRTCLLEGIAYALKDK